MKKFRINYSEGTCFAVPLRSGGFGRGIVSRFSGSGLVFGYFYGPVFSELEEIPPVFPFSSEAAVMSGIFGDLGLVTNEWHRLGELPEWNRCKWELPVFVGKDGDFLALTERDDRLRRVSRRRISPEEAPRGAVEDGVMGAGFVELRLSALLAVA